MLVEAGAEPFIQRSRDPSRESSPQAGIDRCLACCVCADAGYQPFDVSEMFLYNAGSVWVSSRSGIFPSLTLIVMILVQSFTIEFLIQLDNIGIGRVPGILIASAIKTDD